MMGQMGSIQLPTGKDNRLKSMEWYAKERSDEVAASGCEPDKCVSTRAETLNDCCAPNEDLAKCARGFVAKMVGDCAGWKKYICCPSKETKIGAASRRSIVGVPT